MKSIMFNDKYGLTQAVLDGRKTVTRRVINHFGNSMHYGELLGAWYLSDNPKSISDDKKKWLWQLQTDVDDCSHYDLLAPYRVGEIVAIKQSYNTILDNISKNESVEKAAYFSRIISTYDNKGDELFCYSAKDEIKGFSNKMFTKNSLMPHKIKILDIRVERLQDISEKDCLKEGITHTFGSFTRTHRYHWGVDEYGNHSCYEDTPQKAFAVLIDKVGKKGDWERNPFVWRIEYELTK